MKISKKILLVGILWAALASCKKSKLMDADSEGLNRLSFQETGGSGPSPGNFSSEKKANLNVIYFIPADLCPSPNYQKRLSELLLWGQNWYKEQMALNGYPDKTFGLYTDAEKKM